jgi:hypothetical protein
LLSLKGEIGRLGAERSMRPAQEMDDDSDDRA